MPPADAAHRSTSFPKRSVEEWRSALVEQLGEKGFERKLESKTTEGLPIEPLYADAPGRFAALPPRAFDGWRAEVDVDAGGDLDAARDGIRRAIAHGARGLRFHDLRPFNLDYLLDGVDLFEVALHFEGGDPIEYGQALLRVTHEAKIKPKNIHGGFGASPRAATADFARWTRVEFREMTAARISVVDEAEVGAGEALQIGVALAAGTQRLADWSAGGFELELFSRGIEFEFALGTDVFLEMAKLRAARLAWAKLIAAAGGDAEAQVMRLAARSSRRAWSQRDPWSNLLRGTSMTFSAAAGGADSFTLAPYDACLGVSDEEARRLASNTQAILARESRLGAVDDPAAGSGYIEELTETLAREGWTRFQEIQRAGGLTAARESGWLDSAIAEAAEVEERGVRTRRRGLIGVSEFPLLDEELPQRAPKAAPIVGTRLAAPFEVLRDRSDAHLARTGSRPRAYLANLGAIPEHRARATFSANLLAAGGIEALSGDGFDDVEATVEAFASSKATLCVICSSDERYAQSVPTLATALTERGAVVVVAGRPGEHEDAWRAAGVAHFIHLGCDALAVLEQLQSAAGVEA